VHRDEVVQDDGDITGIPVLVLVDVWPQLELSEQGHIRRLIGQVGPPAEILPLTADFVDVVAPLVATHGHAVAQTIAASRALDAAVATFAPEMYEGDLDEDAILPLEE
jgi:hypothetical protein